MRLSQAYRASCLAPKPYPAPKPRLLHTAAWIRAAAVRPDTLDPEVDEVIKAIHATPTRLALTVTGGGVQAISWLLGVPGASRTVLDVQVPYSPTALKSLLGGQAFASASSPDSVAALSQAAFQRAASLTALGTPVAGLACSAALGTDRVRRGEDRVYIAAHGTGGRASFSLVLDKAAPRPRWAQDAVASRLLIHAAALSCGLPVPEGDLARRWLRLEPGDVLESGRPQPPPTLRQALQSLGRGEITSVEAGLGPVTAGAPRGGRLYLPGSFNPLHAGHTAMLQAAQSLCPQLEGCYELSTGNADKGLLLVEEVERRVRHFEEARLPVVLTQVGLAPLYAQKARLFPGSVFVIGYDTAIRLLDPKYYGSREDMLLQLDRLGTSGCSFLVAGRLDTQTQQFMRPEDLAVPPQLKPLFRSIPESLFRADISSTQLRAQGAC
ncbi:hypothetical protein F751_3111 [Auxenochlorella protothecoides]|uniref:Cytidyltransferase-like domain-containing protein n=1 Tax=Auxenochlorella protothecoides TaxID=3075 RepID=A0A087SF89_AUXPR|nr:hypothetical protein F751_3111 [Auxenochlorella protothecoides]KFM24393.1 hypothetical protein F751_3111 [Auxenochlorella protothecoides]